MSKLTMNSKFILQRANLVLTQQRYTSLQHRKKDYDLIVVGGGIVGVASAREILERHPHLKVAILEKEPELAAHQSGHNSGVIHAGIYYKPGSLKAKLCVQGLHLTYAYLKKKLIPFKKCGKLIVATNSEEVSRLMDLYERGKKNDVPNLKLLHNEEEIQKIEPFCEGVKALWSPETGIVDWGKVTQHYASDFKLAGGDVFCNYEVKKFTETKGEKVAAYPITVHGVRNHQILLTKNVLTCGGLQSDLLAEKTGCSREPRIIPFRGEYLLLSKEKQHMVKGNIYPVPDPRFPFLGVHYTPRMDGSVWLGPNAVLAFKREGYKWSDITILELIDALRYPGFIKMSAKYFSFGIKEIMKSALIPLQMQELQKYIPEITEYDVCRGPSGVRAQALDRNGELVDDFVFDQGTGHSPLAKGVLHCRNAPSPGATSSLAIAKMVADKVEVAFGIGNNQCKRSSNV
uniref:L-2-hydroxyglutarate dehydrogenase, mitochondrial n=1 Tax=Glossina brevipalpis TaxID=37001 RepID=A0A1A9WK62_9MUSC